MSDLPRPTLNQERRPQEPAICPLPSTQPRWPARLFLSALTVAPEPPSALDEVVATPSPHSARRQPQLKTSVAGGSRSGVYGEQLLLCPRTREPGIPCVAKYPRSSIRTHSSFPLWSAATLRNNRAVRVVAYAVHFVNLQEEEEEEQKTGNNCMHAARAKEEDRKSDTPVIATTIDSLLEGIQARWQVNQTVVHAAKRS